MRNLLVIAPLLWAFSAGALSLVEFELNPPLPAGWKIRRDKPPASKREAENDIAFMTSPDGRTVITLQIGKMNVREKTASFSEASAAWKKSALEEAADGKIDGHNLKFDIIPHRTGKQAVLSMNLAKGRKKMAVDSRFWIENNHVIRVSAMTKGEIVDPGVVRIFDSIRIKRTSASVTQ